MLKLSEIESLILPLGARARKFIFKIKSQKKTLYIIIYL